MFKMWRPRLLSFLKIGRQAGCVLQRSKPQPYEFDFANHTYCLHLVALDNGAQAVESQFPHFALFKIAA